MVDGKFPKDESVTLVELKQRTDIRTTAEVSITPTNIAEKSSEALSTAMVAIKSIANRIVGSIQEIPVTERPHEVSVEFGLKLTTDANALIVNASTEAQFTVKLKWTRKPDVTLDNEP